jgi:hypothetical protein
VGLGTDEERPINNRLAIDLHFVVSPAV